MLLKPLRRKQHKTTSVPPEEYRTPLRVIKVIQLQNGDSYPICPRCICSLDREYMRYCDRCGQNLDWNNLSEAQVIYRLPPPLCHRHPEKHLSFPKSSKYNTKDISTM